MTGFHWDGDTLIHEFRVPLWRIVYYTKLDAYGLERSNGHDQIEAVSLTGTEEEMSVLREMMNAEVRAMAQRALQEHMKRRIPSLFE